MTTIKTPLEEKLYRALHRIARDYDTAERLMRTGEREYGISGQEALQYAYENIQEEAKFAIRNVRMPRPKKPKPLPVGSCYCDLTDDDCRKAGHRGQLLEG